jgi:hypothetical protein
VTPKRVKRKKLGPTDNWQAEEEAAWAAEAVATAHELGRDVALCREKFLAHAEPQVVQGVVAALRKLADELEQGMQEETIAAPVDAAGKPAVGKRKGNGGTRAVPAEAHLH